MTSPALIHHPIDDTKTIHLDGLDTGAGTLGQFARIVDVGGGLLKWRPSDDSVGIGLPGQRPKVDAGGAVVWEYEDYTIPMVVGNGVTLIAPGMYGGVHIDVPGTIIAATCVALDGQVGSIVFDLWRTVALTIPTVANTITASAKPTITSGVASQDTTLVGWSPVLAGNNFLFVNVDTASVFRKVLLSLRVRKD